jgi:serine protease Do
MATQFSFPFTRRLLSGAALLSMVWCATQAGAYDRRTPVVEAVAKVLPAVVNISTSKEITVQYRSPMDHLFRTPFDDFFNPSRPMFKPREETYKMEGLGSGVIVEGGYVITNNHVIEYDLGTADKIFVNLYSQKEQYEAYVLGADPKADVAILKLEGNPDIPFLPWGRSDDLMIGETVIGVGSSLGQPFTVTQGIISALNRSIQEENGVRLYNLIQTDADINQGNSGGPLVNINAEFIGINTAILSPSGGSVGIGFAIPVARVRKIYDYWVRDILSLEDRMGIEIQEMSPYLDHYYKKFYPQLKDQVLSGIVVAEIIPGSISDEKLQRADIITHVNGRPIEKESDYQIQLEEHTGSVLPLDIIREGAKRTISISIPPRTVERIQWMGMDIQEIDNPYRRWYKISEKYKGLIIHSIGQNTEAMETGLRRGDVITQINQTKINNLGDLKKLSQTLPARQPISIVILRQVNKIKNDWQQYTAQITKPSFF